jgi:hypothetical protein
MRQNYLSAVVLFLALSCAAPAICRAENCPWLNAATAAGSLKGAVTFTVTLTGDDKQDATCEFIHHDGAVRTSLQIEVATLKDPSHDFTAYSAKCGQDATPLRAIGNEAQVCTLRTKNRYSEQVVSRVRERAFIVRMSSNTATADGSELRELTRKIAEQVAGFLF